MAYPKDRCIHGHSRAEYGYRDRNGRQRCHKCDELIRHGPLTSQRRRARGTTPSWSRALSFPVEALQHAVGVMPDDRERTFLTLRLGLDRGKRPRTGREVQEITGFTRQWISLVTVPALDTLVSLVEQIGSDGTQQAK